MRRAELETWLKGHGFVSTSRDVLEKDRLRVIFKPRVATLRVRHADTHLWVSTFTSRYATMYTDEDNKLRGLGFWTVPQLGKLVYDEQEKP